jgi:hypothetical protein
MSACLSCPGSRGDDAASSPTNLSGIRGTTGSPSVRPFSLHDARPDGSPERGRSAQGAGTCHGPSRIVRARISGQQRRSGPRRPVSPPRGPVSGSDARGRQRGAIRSGGRRPPRRGRPRSRPRPPSRGLRRRGDLPKLPLEPRQRRASFHDLGVRYLLGLLDLERPQPRDQLGRSPAIGRLRSRNQRGSGRSGSSGGNSGSDDADGPVSSAAAWASAAASEVEVAPGPRP